MDILLLCRSWLRWPHCSNTFLTRSWALITPACLSLFTSDPLSDYFKFAKVPRYRLGGCGIHILGEWFLFFLRSLQKRPYNFLFQIARGSGATPNGCTFFLQKVHSTRKFLQEHFRVSLPKLPRSILFLPERTWRNKKASEFNHKLLGRLSIQGL
jgi:hypothetical protein